MTRLLIESYLALLRTELVLLFGNFSHLHELVRKSRVQLVRGASRPTAPQLCHAMDLASVFYPKRVMCLQRSAATTMLLRRHGMSAEMVIGAQLFPFKSHAWVEVAGVVANDKPYTPELYSQLERC
jgi:hypothetical protein